MKQQRRSAIRNQRGVALAYVGIGFLVLTGLAAVAIDTAHLALTANEVQIAADAAATSGALRMVHRPRLDFQQPHAAASMGAHDTLRENRIDGHNAENASLAVSTSFDRDPNCLSGPVLVSPAFARINAVTATVTAIVPNLLAGFVPGAAATSTVSRSAKAIVRGSLVPPDLPIAIGNCGSFQDFCFTEGCLPNAVNVQSATAAWTAFKDTPSAPSDIIAYLGGCEGGMTKEPGHFQLHDRINSKVFDRDQEQVIIDAIQCLENQGSIVRGETRFTVPVVHCVQSKVPESAEIVGFARVVITETNPGIVVRPVIDPSQGGPPTPCFYGAGFVELVG